MFSLRNDGFARAAKAISARAEVAFDLVGVGAESAAACAGISMP
jgi:hypothetical protein